MHFCTALLFGINWLKSSSQCTDPAVGWPRLAKLTDDQLLRQGARLLSNLFTQKLGPKWHWTVLSNKEKKCCSASCCGMKPSATLWTYTAPVLQIWLVSWSPRKCHWSPSSCILSSEFEQSTAGTQNLSLTLHHRPWKYCEFLIFSFVWINSAVLKWTKAWINTQFLEEHGDSLEPSNCGISLVDVSHVALFPTWPRATQSLSLLISILCYNNQGKIVHTVRKHTPKFFF